MLSGDGPFKSGQILSASALNRLAGRQARATTGTAFQQTSGGDDPDIIGANPPDIIFIKLTAKTGTTPIKYSWKEVKRTASGTWADASRTGTNTNSDLAIEVNNTDLSVTDGYVYMAQRCPQSGEWLFFLRRNRVVTRGTTLSLSASVNAMFSFSICQDYNWMQQQGRIAWDLNANLNGTAQISQIKYQTSPDNATWTDLKTYNQSVDPDPTANPYSVSIPVGYWVRAVGTTSYIAVFVLASNQMTGKRGAYSTPVSNTVYSSSVQVPSGTGTWTNSFALTWTCNNLNGPAQPAEPSSVSITQWGAVWSGGTYRTSSLYDGGTWAVIIDPPGTSPGSVTVGGVTIAYDYWTTRSGCTLRGNESGKTFFGYSIGGGTFTVSGASLKWVPYTAASVDAYGYAPQGSTFVNAATSLTGGIPTIGSGPAFTNVTWNIPSTTIITALPISYIGTNSLGNSVTVNVS